MYESQGKLTGYNVNQGWVLGNKFHMGGKYILWLWDQNNGGIPMDWNFKGIAGQTALFGYWSVIIILFIASRNTQMISKRCYHINIFDITCICPVMFPSLLKFTSIFGLKFSDRAKTQSSLGF